MKFVKEIKCCTLRFLTSIQITNTVCWIQESAPDFMAYIYMLCNYTLLCRLTLCSNIGAEKLRRSQPRIKPSEAPVAMRFWSNLDHVHVNTSALWTCKPSGDRLGKLLLQIFKKPSPVVKWWKISGRSLRLQIKIKWLTRNRSKTGRYQWRPNSIVHKLMMATKGTKRYWWKWIPLKNIYLISI